MHILDAIAESSIRGECPSALEPHPLEPHRWETDESGHSEAGCIVYDFFNSASVLVQTGERFPRWAAERAVAEAVARNRGEPR